MVISALPGLEKKVRVILVVATDPLEEGIVAEQRHHVSHGRVYFWLYLR